MNDAKLGSWTAAESPVTVEYSLVVIEEIRQQVAEGFQKLSRGGVEVGGVLYGVREERTITVKAMRPIECEHARGPAFVLSDHDRDVLEKQIGKDLEEGPLEGMICVGWFLSHTRSEIMLSDTDLEIYTTYFGAPWQITLVIRPGRGGIMRAGFFVREADGTVRSESSYSEFDFPDRLAGILDRPPRPDRVYSERPPQAALARVENGDAPGPVRAELVRAPQPQTILAAPAEGPRLLPAEPPRRKWIWLMGWIVVLVGLIVGSLRYYVFTPHTQPISLSMTERDGLLQIQWNHAARAVTGAVSGSLAIFDGKQARTVELTTQDLARGKFAYQRNSGDVEVRMTVANSSGDKLGEEASRFLGPPPVRADSDELKTLQKQRDDLQAEVDRLTKENAEQDQRVQELDRTLRILQARMGGK